MNLIEIKNDLMNQLKTSNALTSEGFEYLDKAIEIFNQTKDSNQSNPFWDKVILNRNLESPMNEKYFMLTISQLQIIYS